MAVAAPARRSARPVVALYATGVLAEVCYPLVAGTARSVLTVLTVVVVAAASVGHAASSRGLTCAATLLLCTGVGGYLVELLGVHTGVPFGRYHYAASLGPRAGGVPIVIGLAWTMLAWPAALAARRLGRSHAARVGIGAWALASWDVFLDPQMVAAGHWSWDDPTPHLPGVPGVPLGNYAGWLAVALVVSVVLQRLLAAAPTGDDGWPLAFYLWTWGSSTLALAAFLHLAAAAAWGAAAMGAVALPLARSLAVRR